MEAIMKFEAFAVPRGRDDDQPAVHVSIWQGRLAVHHRLTVDEAVSVHARIGEAVGALKLGLALGSGADPIADDRWKRAQRAKHLGIDAMAIRAIFDMDADEYAQLMPRVTK